MKNEADTSIHTTENSLNEHKSKLPADVVEEVQAEINSVKALVADESVNKDALKEGVEKLKNAAMKMGKTIYSQSQGSDQQQEQKQEGQENQQEEQQENQQQEENKGENEKKN